MIDLHSHFLPGMDDGSASPEESARMLRLSKQQGVDTVVAASHFYALQDNPDAFLRRRQEAFQKIDYDPVTMPKVLLGAEVTYFGGMSHSEDLHKLRIGSTPLLLVEMPLRPWTVREVEDLCELCRQGFLPVLAHVERYLKKGQIPTYEEKLLAEGLLFQCNAEAFLGGMKSWKAFRKMKAGRIHFLGSDAHNMERRISQMDQAAQAIRAKLGQDALDRLDRIAEELLT